MVAIRCRFCFFLQFFFFLFSILFADPVYQVRVNQPGMLVIEVSLDTLWVDEQHVIHTRPALSQIHEPGFPQIPHTGDVLFGLLADVELQVMSGPVITLPIESVKITPGEQAKGIDYEMIPPSWDGEFYPQALSKLEPAGMVNDYSAISIVTLLTRLLRCFALGYDSTIKMIQNTIQSTIWLH